MIKLKNIKDAPKDRPFLVKLNCNIDFSYYVVRYEKLGNKIQYVEAGGEEYMYFDENEIIGWIDLSELDDMITE